MATLTDLADVVAMVDAHLPEGHGANVYLFAGAAEERREVHVAVQRHETALALLAAFPFVVAHARMDIEQRWTAAIPVRDITVPVTLIWLDLSKRWAADATEEKAA